MELFLEEQTSNWQRKISEWERKINSSNIQGSWWFQAVPGNRIKGDYFYAVVQQSHSHCGRKKDTHDSLNLLSSVIFFTSYFILRWGECGYWEGTFYFTHFIYVKWQMVWSMKLWRIYVPWCMIVMPRWRVDVGGDLWEIFLYFISCAGAASQSTCFHPAHQPPSHGF